MFFLIISVDKAVNHLFLLGLLGNTAAILIVPDKCFPLHVTVQPDDTQD